MQEEDLLSGLSINREEAPSTVRHRAVYMLLVFMLLGAGGLAAWSFSSNGGEAQSAQETSSPSAPADPEQNPQPLNSPAPREISGERDVSILDATGYVVAMRIATVSSRTVGLIEEVLVEEGMEVEKGQVLARLDTTSQRIQLDLNRARLSRAEALFRESENRLKEAELALDRAERMYENQLISEEEIDNARIRVDTVKAELDRQAADIEIARQEIRLQQQQIEDNIIRAPFSGVVVQKNAQPGEIVSPSTSAGSFTRTGICTLVDMSSLEIEVDVNESYINRVFVGQRAEATLDAYPSLVIPAEVSAIVPTADRQRATIKVRVRFRELDSRILPDMGVKVSFYES